MVQCLTASSQAASARVRAYGAGKAVAGDLVCEEPGGADAAAAAGRRTDSGGGVMDMRVRRLTAEEAAEGRYGVRDVVLPMPAQAVEVGGPPWGNPPQLDWHAGPSWRVSRG